MRILVAEDEIKVQNFIRQALEQAGMVVDAVGTFSDLMAYLDASPYEVVVLDRMLQGYDTVKSVHEIRRRFLKTKILILSALSEAEEKVQGLTEGADDYLEKPFHVVELIARIRSLCRRADMPDKRVMTTSIQVDDLRIDLDSQRIFRKGKRIDLTGKEFRLLTLLAHHPGEIYSKTRILNEVWDLNHYPESNVVEVTVANLRAKIDREGRPLLHSRRGVGYWLGSPE